MKIYFPELASKSFDEIFKNTTPNLEFDVLLENDFIENFLSEIKKIDIPESLITEIQDILFFCKNFLQKKETFLLHTSGSTGTPKPINISYIQMCESVKMTQKALNLTSKDVFCVCLPTGFIAGKMMLARALYLGCEMWIYKPSVDFFEKINHDFSFIALVPPQLQHILANPIHTQLLDKCKNVIVGGSPISVFLRNEIQEKLSNANIFLTYGMTETVSHIALQKLNFPPLSPTLSSEGKGQEYMVLEGVEIAQVLDKNSLQFGCLKIKSPTTNHEWITTNDRVKILGENTFKWLGRVDNVVNIGGKKVQLEEIELVFEQFFTKNNLPNLQFYAKTEENEIWGMSIVLVLSWENILQNEAIFLENFPFFKNFFSKKKDKKNDKKEDEILTKENDIFQKIIFVLQTEMPKHFIPQKIIILEKFKKTATQKLIRT